MAAIILPSKQFTITLLGDLMLGRLIDQLLPVHVDEPEEADIIAGFRQRYSHLRHYTHVSPWGNALSLFEKSDLVLGNLETSITTHSVKWPDKVFNYRTHPDNVKCLTEAGIDYVSLANNHTLDFSLEGLLDTVRTLKNDDIGFAGAGENTTEAGEPAQLSLPSSKSPEGNVGAQHTIHVYSFSDHPPDWKSIPQFNHLNYTDSCKHELRNKLMRKATAPALKLVSVHWGPNYRWHPDDQIRDMAHFFIDECGVDVVWGHSSHHVQGVELYKGKLVIYGCGDFVDDYAVNRVYRNDLSAVWNLEVEPNDDGKLRLKRLEVFPNRIQQFQATLLQKTDADHAWVCEKFRSLSGELGTEVDEDLGADGQIVVDLYRQ